MVHIAATRMIYVGIDGMSRWNDLGGIIRGIYHLKCIPLHLGDLEISKDLEGWIRSWWGPGLESLSPEGWLTRGKGQGDYLWDTAPAATETDLELTMDSKIKGLILPT